MPIQQNPNKRRGEERSETLIIPHITREMLEVARAMAEKGASRAEIEAALAAMQTGKAPAAPAAPAPEKQPGAPQQPADTLFSICAKRFFNLSRTKNRLAEIENCSCLARIQGQMSSFQ